MIGHSAFSTAVLLQPERGNWCQLEGMLRGKDSLRGMRDSLSVATEAGKWPPKNESDRSRNERIRSRDRNSFLDCLSSSLCLRNDDPNGSGVGRCGRAAEKRSEGNQKYTGLGLVVRG